MTTGANNFKPFAVGGSANAITQSAYEALTTLIANGFLDGVADASKVNKVLRQAAFGSAVLGEIVAANGVDALDDGDVPGFKTKLMAALTAALVPTVTSVPAPVGSSRNTKMSVTAASATATFTADEVIVETALGGTAYRLGSYSQSINLATTGAGGMDTGSAPASGFVSLYAITKADGTKNILACNASTSGGSIYSGANMPTDYVASALIGVWPTNGSGQFVPGLIYDRDFYNETSINVLNVTSSPPTTYTSISLSGATPPNAKSVSLNVGQPNSGSAMTSAIIAGSANGLGGAMVSMPGNSYAIDSFYSVMQLDVPIITAQTIYYRVGTSVNGLRINVIGYSF